MKHEIIDNKIVVKETLDKSKGKVNKITTNDVKKYLQAEGVVFDKCVMSDLLVSDDENKLSGTWIFSVPEKQSTMHKVLDLHPEGVIAPPPPDEVTKVSSPGRKKKTQKTIVLVPSEE